MSDIVDRLRSYKVGAHDGPPLHPALCDEAADEIERLRDALSPKLIPEVWHWPPSPVGGAKP